MEEINMWVKLILLVWQWWKFTKNKIAIDDSHLFFSLFYSPFFSSLLCSALLCFPLLSFTVFFILFYNEGQEVRCSRCLRPIAGSEVYTGICPSSSFCFLCHLYYCLPDFSASYVTSNVVFLISLHQHPSQRFLDRYE